MIITIINDRKLFLGNAVDENRKPSNRVLKFKKSLIATSRKFNSPVKNLDRLVGGADAPEEREEIPILAEETVEQTEVVETVSAKIENGKSIRTVGPCCICMSQAPESTGYKYYFPSFNFLKRQKFFFEKAISVTKIIKVFKALFCKCRDKKVDEMIDYVHHNLQEVGKALASLGENFEHDSKVEPCTQVESS